MARPHFDEADWSARLAAALEEDTLARPHFDEADWSARLAAALETVAAHAQPSYSLRPPEMMRSGPTHEYWSALHLGYRDLAARTKHDPAVLHY